MTRRGRTYKGIIAGWSVYVAILCWIHAVSIAALRRGWSDMFTATYITIMSLIMIAVSTRFITGISWTPGKEKAQ